ncbi:plasmolipin [Bombina bombina]|uniref:plasmolipin n=1 Tax=Bombina bombina TaxID=8345 RepID=UPI00235A946C|nr:plasmolipin [Bombina bombina]
MAEFPSKVSTQTSTPEASRGISGFLSFDVDFVRSIPGLLMILEFALGLLVWALIADTNYRQYSAYGWVMFVAIFCWLVTLILFVIYMLQLQRKMTIIPWPIVILGYHVAATLLYITGFITCAASVQTTSKVTESYNKRAAASFFACLVMIAYGASTFFSFMAWRGGGSNAASAQA